MLNRFQGWKRWQRALVVLVALEALYLVAAQLFLWTPWGLEVINRKPEKLRVAWSSAWSVVPGVLHARDVEIRGQNRSVQWYAQIDTVRAPVVLPLLALKRFETWAPRGRGVDFRLRRRVDTTSARADQLGTPEIPGVENPPSPAPEELYPLRDKSWRWRIGVRGLALDDVQRVWIDRLRAEGAGSFSGGLDFRIRGALEVPRARLDLPAARIEIAGALLGEHLLVEIDGSMSSFEPRQVEGREALDSISGRFVLSGAIQEVGVLDALIGATAWLGVDASGKIDAALHLENGVLAAPSRLVMATGDLGVRFVGYRAAGVGRVFAEVRPGDDPPRLVAEVELLDVEVQREAWETPHARAGRVALTTDSAALQLSAEPFVDLHARVDLEAVEIPDLTVYNAYLPPSAGLTLRGGSAELSGWVESWGDRETAEGSVTFESTDASLALGDLLLDGHLALATHMPRAWLDERRYDLSTSKIELSDVALSGEGEHQTGWWARFALPSAELIQGERFELDAKMTASMRDTAPIVALLTQRRKIFGLVDGWLTVEDVTVSAEIRTHGDSFELEGFQAEGDGLEILGDLEKSDRRHQGLWFLSLNGLTAAVEIDGGEREWKLVRSRRWFEERRAGKE